MIRCKDMLMTMVAASDGKRGVSEDLTNLQIERDTWQCRYNETDAELRKFRDEMSNQKEQSEAAHKRLRAELVSLKSELAMNQARCFMSIISSRLSLSECDASKQEHAEKLESLLHKGSTASAEEREALLSKSDKIRNMAVERTVKKYTGEGAWAGIVDQHVVWNLV